MFKKQLRGGLKCRGYRSRSCFGLCGAPRLWLMIRWITGLLLRNLMESYHIKYIEKKVRTRIDTYVHMLGKDCIHRYTHLHT